MFSPAARMNLTRDEAHARALLLQVTSYDVELDLSAAAADATTFGSRTTVRFGCREPGAGTFVDLVADRVTQVSLNGRPLDPGEVFDGTRIHLDDLAAANELVVAARCRYMNTGEGLHRFVDPVDDAVYLYTQFQVADARRVFTVFDQPDLKATFAFTVTAPEDWQVVSNEPTPHPEPAAPGTATWRFRATPRVPSYITAVVAGPYHRVDGEYGSGDRVVPMAVFCRASLAEHLDAEVILELTRAGFGFFEAMFDLPYPFTKYDQLFVPEYNSGAMENAGAVILHEDYVFRSRAPEVSYERRAVTILHELAHMWFGDLVTMTWWDDLWLNESFAEWVSTLAAAEATPWRSAWTTFANTDKTWAYRQDQLPSTHPIVAEIRDLEDVVVNFDGITYAKGAAVLKQLAAWVGRDAFVAGLRAYFTAFAWANTTLADLLGSLAEASGRDLSDWAAQWLETAGVNTLRAQFQTDAQGRFSSFDIVQSAPADWPTLRSHHLAVGLYERTADGVQRTRRVELEIVGARTPVAALVGTAQPDLVLVNDDDLTYAKVRLDERSLRTLRESIGDIREALPRSLAWSGAWDMTRDGEMSTQDYVALVLAGVGTETDSSVVRTVLAQAGAAVVLYCDPAIRDATRSTFADGLLERVRSADAGSDAQLQLVRAFVSAACADAHLDVVQALLDGTWTMPGLQLDADLRWHLLRRLVAAGRAGDDDIDRELSADATAAGQRHAAAARAARPTSEAKAAAWAAVVERAELPHAVLASMVGGFAHIDQYELLQPYVERYFDALVQVWAERTNEMAQLVVTGMFPALLAEPATLARTDRWLAEHPDAPAALRRLVIEARDGMARALRAQRRSAEPAGTP